MIRSELLHASKLVELVVFEKKYFFFCQSIVFLRDTDILESCLNFTTTNDIFTVEVIILLKQFIKVIWSTSHIFVFWISISQTRKTFELLSLMLVLGAIFAFLTPIFSYTRIVYIGTACAAYISSLVNIQEWFLTNLTKHITLSNEFSCVGRRPLIFRNLYSLKLMRMFGILLVTLIAKCKIITGKAIEPIASPLNSTVTFIAGVPSFKALILLLLFDLFLHRLSKLLFILLSLLLLLLFYKLISFLFIHFTIW